MVDPVGFGVMRLRYVGAALCVCCWCIERCLSLGIERCVDRHSGPPRGFLLQVTWCVALVLGCLCYVWCVTRCLASVFFFFSYFFISFDRWIQARVWFRTMAIPTMSFSISCTLYRSTSSCLYSPVWWSLERTSIESPSEAWVKFCFGRVCVYRQRLYNFLQVEHFKHRTVPVIIGSVETVWFG